MKKLSRNLVFFLLITSILLPILPAITVAQGEDDVVFRLSASALPGDWDPAITDGYNVVYGSYFFSACEYPCGGNADFYGGVYKPLAEEWKPILVTDWILENWPAENNSLGFINTGGNMAMTLTLRNGVTFHDGSNWNATVFKWNIDRKYIITGNLTGDGDTRNQDTYWGEISDASPYFTLGWNLTHLDAPDATTDPWVPPDPTKYAGYYIGNETTYPGVTDVDGWVYNSNPYGGWDPIALNFINYAPYDKYPLIGYVEILDNAASGGVVKVHYNSWNSYGMEGGLYSPQLSYHAYHKNYTNRGIYGYENGVKDSKNPTIVDQMIGTGPYIFVEHDQTGSPPGGYMIKNENYWNKTALEADGWFEVDIREVVNFPTGELGRDSQNTALLTHAIDYAYDSMYMPVDYDAVIRNKNIDYIEDDPSEYITQITLNCINESWWAEPGTEAWRTGTAPGVFPSDKETAGGIPRALREAINYAFNYDNMINTVLNGRAIRGGGLLSEANIYYNASVNLPGYDLAKARNILLTTENDTHTRTYSQKYYNFSKLCADRGLTAISTNAQWQNIADTNPIFVVDFYWDGAHEDLKSVFQASLRNIGVALKDKTGANNRVPTIIWDTVGSYWLSTFDGSHSIWSANAWVMDYNMPDTIPEGWIDANYGNEFDYWPAWNFNFNYDDDIQFWIDRMYMSSPDQKITWISKICDKENNELFPMVFCYQAKGGFCLWKDWETFFVPGRSINRTGYWGGISTHFLRYVGLPDQYALIPGSPLMITLSVSAVSMIGIIYSLLRKKKL